MLRTSFRNLAYSLDNAVLEVIAFFKNIIEYGHTINLTLVGIMLTLSIVTGGFKVLTNPSQSNTNIAQVAYKLAITLVLVFIIRNIDTIALQFTEFITESLAKGIGKNTSEEYFISPTAVLQYGVRTFVQPYIDLVNEETSKATGIISTVRSYFAFENIFLTGASIALIIAFMVLAIQLVVSQIELYIVLSVSVITIPWTLFKPTEFIGSGVYKLLAGHAIKLGVVAMVIGLGVSTMDRLHDRQEVNAQIGAERIERRQQQRTENIRNNDIPVWLQDDFSVVSARRERRTNTIGETSSAYVNAISDAVVVMLIAFIIIWLANTAPSIAASLLTGAPASRHGIVQVISHSLHIGRAVKAAMKATSGDSTGGAKFVTSGFSAGRGTTSANPQGSARGESVNNQMFSNGMRGSASGEDNIG